MTSILKTMNSLSSRFDSAISGSPFRAALVEAGPKAKARCFLVLLFCLALFACGKKGPLFLPVDEATLQELETVQEELDEAEERNRKKDSTTAEPSEPTE